jgi:hypothetical protein
MKQLRFAGPLFYAVLVSLFSSCSGGSEKTTATDSAVADTAAKAVAPVVNTIVTTPQNMVVVMQKVANYDKWKMGYDGHDSVRISHGVHNYVIGRGLMDSNMVIVALKIDDTTKAMAFAKDPGLKKVMQKAGVIGKPTMAFTTAVWEDTAMIDSKIRSRTTFMVKDWDAWQKAFDEGKQERADNGIAVRAITHDLHDSKKVYLVTAILDTAKAFAYYKSDALKKRRAASGVVGEPVRFLYRVVQRY